MYILPQYFNMLIEVVALLHTSMWAGISFACLDGRCCGSYTSQENLDWGCLSSLIWDSIKLS
jgi:hypothetical protein